MERLPSEIKLQILMLVSRFSAQDLVSLAKVSRSFYKVYKDESEHPSLKLLLNVVAVDCGNLCRLARRTGAIPADATFDDVKNMMEKCDRHDQFALWCHGDGTIKLELFPEMNSDFPADPAILAEREKNKKAAAETVKKAIRIHHHAIKLAKIIEERYCQIVCCEMDSQDVSFYSEYESDCPNRRKWEYGSLESRLAHAYSSTILGSAYRYMDHNRLEWTVNVYIFWLALDTLNISLELGLDSEAEHTDEWIWLRDDMTQPRDVFPLDSEEHRNERSGAGRPSPLLHFEAQTTTLHFTRWLAMEMLTVTRGKGVLFPGDWESKLTKKEKRRYYGAVERALKKCVNEIMRKENCQTLYSVLNEGTWPGDIIEGLLFEELRRGAAEGTTSPIIGKRLVRKVFKGGTVDGFWGNSPDDEGSELLLYDTELLKDTLARLGIENQFCDYPRSEPYFDRNPAQAVGW